MRFELSEDQRALETAARAFAAAELAPHSARWDEEEIFPVETLKLAAWLGFAGLYVKDDVGGSALTRLDAAIVFEALAGGDVSTPCRSTTWPAG
jgi:alkylation response protein AidB-like acyl-CoA dehydrogenase